MKSWNDQPTTTTIYILDTLPKTSTIQRVLSLCGTMPLPLQPITDWGGRRAPENISFEPGRTHTWAAAPIVASSAESALQQNPPTTLQRNDSTSPLQGWPKLQQGAILKAQAPQDCILSRGPHLWIPIYIPYLQPLLQLAAASTAEALTIGKDPAAPSSKIAMHFHDIGMDKDFMIKLPKAIATKAKIDKWDRIKLRSFCTAKETIIRANGQPTEWQKIFAIYPSNKGLKSRIYKELKQIYKKNTNNAIKNWAKHMNRHFSKKDIYVANKHEEKLNISDH
ncbi:retrotransposable element ORF2 protein [Plecturocebus cupreus]